MIDRNRPGARGVAHAASQTDSCSNANPWNDNAWQSAPTWAENSCIFGDVSFAFRVSFLNRSDEAERPLLAEYYQSCLDEELPALFLRCA